MVDRNIRHNMIFRLLLYPLSFIYGFVTQVRNLFFDAGIFRIQQFPIPVISVGNISAGGTGKTPMTMWLINLLEDEFNKIAIVSRGYKRKTKGMVVVSDGRGNITTAQEGGDEPVLIATKCPQCPVIVAEKRSQGVKKALADFTPDLIILDDAFQHRWVHRSCDIVLLDARQSLQDERVLPLGNLRERLSNLQRADILIFTKSKESPVDQDLKLVKEFFSGPIFMSKYLPTQIVDLQFKPILNVKSMMEQGVVAIAGISDPNLFMQFINVCGFEVKNSKYYPDHHNYTEQDIEEIKTIARENNTKYLCTTEKDLVKLSGFDFNGLEVCALSIKIELEDHEMLRQIIIAYIDKGVKNV